MSKAVKRGLVERMKQVGAYDVKIADPRRGFEHGIEGTRPLELWPECRAVVVFAVATSPSGNNTYIGPYAPWGEGDRKVGPVPSYVQSEEYAMDRVSRLLFDAIGYKGMAYLDDQGFRVSFKRPRMKICAYEAGLGVYGKAGFIIHPELGSRMRLGVLLTDAELPPDGRLEGFDPCDGCTVCMDACPAKAFDPSKRYPASYDRERCMNRRAEIASRELYCHNCYASCPAGTLSDRELLMISEVKSIYSPRIRERDAVRT